MGQFFNRVCIVCLWSYFPGAFCKELWKMDIDCDWLLCLFQCTGRHIESGGQGYIFSDIWLYSRILIRANDQRGCVCSDFTGGISITDPDQPDQEKLSAGIQL